MDVETSELTPSPGESEAEPEHPEHKIPREINGSGLDSENSGLVRVDSCSSTISCESFRSDRSKEEPDDFKGSQSPDSDGMNLSTTKKSVDGGGMKALLMYLPGASSIGWFLKSALLLLPVLYHGAKKKLFK